MIIGTVPPDFQAAAPSTTPDQKKPQAGLSCSLNNVSTSPATPAPTSRQADIERLKLGPALEQRIAKTVLNAATRNAGEFAKSSAGIINAGNDLAQLDQAAACEFAGKAFCRLENMAKAGEISNANVTGWIQDIRAKASACSIGNGPDSQHIGALAISALIPPSAAPQWQKSAGAAAANHLANAMYPQPKTLAQHLSATTDILGGFLRTQQPKAAAMYQQLMVTPEAATAAITAAQAQQLLATVNKHPADDTTSFSQDLKTASDVLAALAISRPDAPNTGAAAPQAFTAHEIIGHIGAACEVLNDKATFTKPVDSPYHLDTEPRLANGLNYIMQSMKHLGNTSNGPALARLLFNTMQAFGDLNTRAKPDPAHAQQKQGLLDLMLRFNTAAGLTRPPAEQIA